MGTAIKHPVPDWVKPSFVIFDIRALWRSALMCIYHLYILLCTLPMSVHLSCVLTSHYRTYVNSWFVKANSSMICITNMMLLLITFYIMMCMLDLLHYVLD